MTTYCLDSNVYIEAWNKYWSIDLCPDYWGLLDSMARKGLIYSPVEVKSEIEKVHDDLYRWVKQRDYLFQEIDETVQIHLREIMRHFPRLVDSIKIRSVADPWVIALARAKGGTVVTKEDSVGPDSNRVHIPDVCESLSVPWLSDYAFARQVGIRFSAQIVGSDHTIVTTSPS